MKGAKQLGFMAHIGDKHQFLSLLLGSIEVTVQEGKEKDGEREGELLEDSSLQTKL